MLTEEQLQDIFELSDLMSNGDRELFLQLREVVFASDPHEILNFMERILDSESFDDFLDRVGESEKENLWLILIKLLEHLNYICVRDYKDNLEDFIYFFDCLQQVRNAGISLKLDSGGLSPIASISEWARVIDNKYLDENFCLGAVDMDTDSYYLFFSKQATFIRLQELAGNLGYRIDYAKNM
ncbi:DUF6630 family protein [Streptococcus suis]|uniref:DUF6630 family protein n=1 Tax=Streptococcus suis TaxID=1307 RepID=UPI0005BBC2EE|nr:DUF6630 family protein [Streptococcus suis]MBS7944309.1 hypothetical protein [Streptococcus suis]CYU20376.1 Uncharacterised protein [Streptococcus suis]HEM6538608.1 hypothetical protein [Streptococcus suis]HEM6563333.1 hypothetical protein [Streptococcus suis]